MTPYNGVSQKRRALKIPSACLFRQIFLVTATFALQEWKHTYSIDDTNDFGAKIFRSNASNSGHGSIGRAANAHCARPGQEDGRITSNLGESMREKDSSSSNCVAKVAAGLVSTHSEIQKAQTEKMNTESTILFPCVLRRL